VEAAKEVKVNDGQCAKCLVSAAYESCFLAEKIQESYENGAEGPDDVEQAGGRRSVARVGKGTLVAR